MVFARKRAAAEDLNILTNDKYFPTTNKTKLKFYQLSCEAGISFFGCFS